MTYLKTTRKFRVWAWECGNIGIFEYFSNKTLANNFQFALLVMQSNHKNIFRTKHDGISSILMWNQWGDNPIWSLVGPNTQILTKKMHQNIGMMQIPSPFEPFDNDKSIYFWDQKYLKFGHLTPRVSKLRGTPSILPLILNKSHHNFSWICFYGYFVW